MVADMNKSSVKQFVMEMGRLLERIDLPPSIKNESDLEYAVLPHLKAFIRKKLTLTGELEGIVYHHGRTKEEKKWWKKSKPLQTVLLYGTHVSDMFVAQPDIREVALEFTYKKLSRKKEGLTSHIQRAIGQSMIATLRHPFAICMIVYEAQHEFPDTELVRQLKEKLWKRGIYLIIRKR